jgi:hypothetical protein
MLLKIEDIRKLRIEIERANMFFKAMIIHEHAIPFIYQSVDTLRWRIRNELG